MHHAFQSTGPTRGATRPLVLVTHVILVSIHAPHEGRDLATSTSSLVTAGFNPPPPPPPPHRRWRRGVPPPRPEGGDKNRRKKKKYRPLVSPPPPPPGARDWV